MDNFKIGAFHNSHLGSIIPVPYPYSNALFTTQDNYGMCLHRNNAIQLTLYMNQCIQYDYHPVLYITPSYTLYITPDKYFT